MKTSFSLLDEEQNKNEKKNIFFYFQAVENWRQKREQKRKQSLKSDRLDDEPSVSISNIESTRPLSPPIYK